MGRGRGMGMGPGGGGAPGGGGGGSAGFGGPGGVGRGGGGGALGGMIARAQSGDATPVSESFFDSFNKRAQSRFEGEAWRILFAASQSAIQLK
jgi:hypothetical protein